MKKVALGEAYPTSLGAVEVKGKLSDEERLAALEQQLSYLIMLVTALRARIKKDSENAYVEGPAIEAPHGLNKDGVPIGLVCLGDTGRHTFPVCLMVEKEFYTIGAKKYTSLSAAAEEASGTAGRSGWSFWKLPDGRTLKQALNKR